MNNDIRKFYDILFDPGEYTCFGNSIYDVKLYSVTHKGPKADSPFFTINPMEKGTSRAIKNVTKFRNFLFEMDQDAEGNKIEFKDQAKYIFKCGLPFSTAVESGGKSIHWIVSLQDPFEDKVEYDAMWKAIAEVLKNEGAPIDTAVKDPSRFSRAAGAVRVETKQIQSIKKLNARVTSDELLTWLESHNVDWTKYIYKPSHTEMIHEVNLEASDEEKKDYVINVCMRNEKYAKGNRNHYQFRMALLLRRTGLDIKTTESIIQHHCGEIVDSGGQIKSAYNKTDIEPIYVWSKEEKRQWAKEQEAQESQREQAEYVARIINNESEYDRDSHLNYFYVRDELMKLLPNNQIVKWREQKFKQDFNPQTLNVLHNYDGFCNLPSYLEYQPVVNNSYNIFNRPTIDALSGDWSTIHKLLCHVFDDQLELGLDYIQLLFTRPTQRLPILCVVSSEQGTGKSTFFNMLNRLAGHGNAIIIDSSEFEARFNVHYATKHLIMLDEAGGFENPKKVNNKLKLWGTQKTVNVEGKGQNVFEVDYYGKILIASNDEENFITMDDNDSRYWVRKVPKLSNEQRDAHFEDRIEKELPHFLHYIFNREMFTHESQGRLWFTPEQYETIWLSNVKKSSKGNLYHDIKSIFEQWFSDFPEEQELYFTTKGLKLELSSNAYKSDYNSKYFNRTLVQEFGLTEPNTNSRQPDGFKAVAGAEISKSQGRWWMVHRSTVMMEVFDKDDLFG